MEPATRSAEQLFDPQSRLLVNGGLVGAVGYHEFVLWDTASGKIRHRVPAELGEVAAVWAWGGERLAFQGPGSRGVRVITVDGGDVANLLADGPAASFLSLSPNGGHLAAALFAGGVRTFDLASVKEHDLALAGGNPQARVSVGHTAEGELLVGSSTDQVPAQLWDAAGSSMRWSGESAREYYHVRKAGDRFVTLTANQTGFVVEVRDASFAGLTEYPIDVFPSGLVVNAHGSQAAIVTSSGPEARVANVMDLATGAVRRFEGNGAAITDVAFTSDGATLLALSSTDGVQAFDVGTGKATADFELPT